MKKRALFIISFSILNSQFSIFNSLSANPVDMATARKAAVNFMGSMGVDMQHNAIDASKSAQWNEYYVINLADGGYVLVSSDDNSEPIIAYSDKGSFAPATMPPSVKAWMSSYDCEIAYNRQQEQHGKKNSTAKEQWQRLLSGLPLMEESKAVVEPMLQTTWNQSPYYNSLCPYDSANNARAVCGCTATATSQIMKYFNHPQTGYGDCTWHHRLGDLYADYGSTTYQWDSMPLYLSGNSTDGEVDAVATLIYHIGVSVSMDYSARGSGGKTCAYGYGGDAASENSLKYNFKYSPYVWSAFRIDYDLAGWKNLMKNELNNGRPILYAGYDEVQAGHAFVLDGYNNVSLFHINWGWGGQYDAYYRITELTPADANGSTHYNFNLFATATIGIEPYDRFGEASTTVNTFVEGTGGLTPSDGTVTGGGLYNFGDTIVMTATPNNDNCKFVQWSDGCKYNPRSLVATGGELNFTAQFAPLRGETMRYHTTDNSMNRASNIPAGLGCDSVWGICIPESALWNGDKLTAVRFMGYKEGTFTLSIYQGVDSPSEQLYTATFRDTLAYPYIFYTHSLPTPLNIDSQKSLWIKLKCTDVDTCGVFSIWSGNQNSMLVGEDLHPCNAKFSWMIEGLFDFSNSTAIEETGTQAALLAEIFPNPTSGTFTISLPENTGDALITIMDINGRVLTRRHLAAGETQFSSSLNSGVYLIRISTHGATTIKKLIVK